MVAGHRSGNTNYNSQIRDAALNDANSTITYCFYNGVEFPETSNFRLRCQHVYNDSDNSIIYNKYTLSVESIIYMDDIFIQSGTQPSNNDADTTVGRLRTVLSKPGQNLSFSNAGFGVFGTSEVTLINSETTVDQSPKPRIMLFENLGGGKTIHLVWEVEFALQECKQGSDASGSGVYSLSNSNIISYEFSKEWRIGERLRFSQTYNFHLQTKAPITVSGRKHTADNAYKIFLNNTAVYQFPYYPNTKVEFDYTLSENQREITGSISYHEIDTDDVYPTGIEFIDVEHTIESQLESGGKGLSAGGAFTRWANTMEGEIRTYPGYPKAYAWEVFLAIFRDRYLRGLSVIVEKNDYGKKIRKAMRPWVVSIKLTDRMFSQNAVSFSMQWVNHVNSFSDILNKTGLFQPYRKNSWREWNGSWSGYLSGATGKVETGQFQQTAVDACHQPINIGRYNEPVAPSQIPYVSVSTPACPDQKNSWLDYKINIKLISLRNYRRHKRYADTNQKPGLSLAAGTQYETKIDPSFEIASGIGDEITQVMGFADQTAMMKGYALRYGGPTQIPSIKTIGGKDVDLLYEDFDTIQMSSMGCPLFLTKWTKIYHIKGNIQNTTNIPYTLDPSIRPGDFQSG